MRRCGLGATMSRSRFRRRTELPQVAVIATPVIAQKVNARHPAKRKPAPRWRAGMPVAKRWMSVLECSACQPPPPAGPRGTRARDYTSDTTASPLQSHRLTVNLDPSPPPRQARDPHDLRVEIERTLDSLNAAGDGEWTLLDLGPRARGTLFRHRGRSPSHRPGTMPRLSI
jgi:hypothetical protein